MCEPVLPDEAEHLVRVAHQRLAVGALVMQLTAGRLPDTVGSFRGWNDAVLGEAFTNRFAEIVLRIIWPEFAVSRQQRTQEVAELKVGRRAIVESADAHGQEMLGDVSYLFDHALPVEEDSFLLLH